MAEKKQYNKEKMFKEFEEFFGPVDLDTVLNDPFMYDSIFLTRDMLYLPQMPSMDKRGYFAMHYCVASLIINHKYKPKKDPDKITTESQEETDNRWIRSVQVFLATLRAGNSINALPPARGFNLSANYEYEGSPLMYAIDKKAPADVIKMLIKYGAYIDQDWCSGTSVLGMSIPNNFEAAEILLQAGADPNIVDDGLETPIFYLFSECYENETTNADVQNAKRFLKLLLDYGANPDRIGSTDQYCEMPEDVSYMKEREEQLGITGSMRSMRELLQQYTKRKIKLDL